MWIDSHVHLVSDELYDDFDELVDNMKENKVQKALIICGSLLEIERALNKVENDRMFDLAVGLHPGSVSDVNEEEFKEMMTYLTHPKVVAVGEIGLDYYWDESNKPLQIDRFKTQISLANKHDLPIIVHLRSSKEDLKEILMKNPVDNKGVIHCFSETIADAKQFIDMGYYLGYGGIATFKNGQNVRDALAVTPLNRILTETDAPYLAPVPKRGKRNEPSFVSYTGSELARLKEMNQNDFQVIVKENYYRLFRRSSKI